MVELPQGVVIEVRRGSHDSLRQLAGDMSRLGISGHIRIERKPKELMPRVSQIVINNGVPAIAIHESDVIQMGLEALVEIESDATALDALISLHELSKEEIEQIIRLYPDADIYPNNNDESMQDGQWWNQVKLQSRRWERDNRLPEVEPTVDAPEIIRQKSEAQLRRLDEEYRVLNLGDVLLVDSDDSGMVMELSSAFAGHGRPIMAISRTHFTKLNRQYDIPLHSSIWLSSKDDNNAVSPDLDILRKKVLNFLWANKQAIVAIDGLEYLSSKNDDLSLLDFIRTISDEIRMEDHALLISCDLSAFSSLTRHHLIREVEELNPQILELWLMEAESLSEHPICVEMSDEESAWIEQQLNLVSSQSDEMFGSLNGILSGGSSSIEDEDVLAASENLAKVVQEWDGAVIQVQPVQGQTMIEGETIPSEISEAPIPELELSLNQEVMIENGEEIDLIAPIVQEIKTSSNAIIRPVKKNTGPRKAIRIKRRKVKRSKAVDSKVHGSRNRMSAAAQMGIELDGFDDIEILSKSKLSIAGNIDQIASKQESAFIKTFKTNDARTDSSLIQASKQKAAKRIANMPKVVFSNDLDGVINNGSNKVDAKLNGRMPRGVSVKPKNSKFSRESASREQTHTNVESSYNNWKSQDLESQNAKVDLFDEQGKPIKRLNGDDS